LDRILTQQAPYFYARTTVYHLNHFKTCIREAFLWKGFSFVDIISDCIELNGRRLGFKTAHQMFKWFDERFHIVEGERDHLQEDELGIAKAAAEEIPQPVEKEKVVWILMEDLKLHLRNSTISTAPEESPFISPIKEKSMIFQQVPFSRERRECGVILQEKI
jgi:pyruvate/2-oxoacid:ferredoxin oxidoreductase beta subunit